MKLTSMMVIGMAVVMRNPGGESLRMLHEWICQHLAEHKHPPRWYLLDDSAVRVRRAVFVAFPHRGTYAAHCAWGEGRPEMMPGSAFLDTLNDSYSAFALRLAEPYDDWREYSYEEQVALQRMRRSAAFQYRGVYNIWRSPAPYAVLTSWILLIM